MASNESYYAEVEKAFEKLEGDQEYASSDCSRSIIEAEEAHKADSSAEDTPYTPHLSVTSISSTSTSSRNSYHSFESLTYLRLKKWFGGSDIAQASSASCSSTGEYKTVKKRASASRPEKESSIGELPGILGICRTCGRNHEELWIRQQQYCLAEAQLGMTSRIRGWFRGSASSSEHHHWFQNVRTFFRRLFKKKTHSSSVSSQDRSLEIPSPVQGDVAVPP